MQIWKLSDTCRSVGILLFDSFSNHCLANAVEPLRAANTLSRKQLYRWHFLSLDGSGVTSSSGLPVQPEMALSAHSGGDYLFVIPSYDFEKHATVRCSRALRAASQRFKVVAAMDTGSWLLASAGLLDGRRATIHWDELVRFAETFPEIDVTEDRIVEDGRFLSCGGVTTTFELVLNMIEQHHGPMLRLEVSSLFMYGESATVFAAPPGSPRNRKVQAAAALMRRNIEAPLSVPDVAQRVGLSQKAFTDACLKTYGIGPRRLYQAIRLREARRLSTSTDLTIEEIANRCGYQNPSALTRAFRSEFGASPSSLRRSP